MEVITNEKVPIVFTSAGNPGTWTNYLKDHEVKVIHVVSSSRFALKAENAGCDAVVAEGFEAGGHNGREETTTLVLIPLVCESVKIPVIAAGGISTGRQMLAAMVLGAEGVQVGSRFAASIEASLHTNFKNAILKSSEGDTVLCMKKITPVRILKNKFFSDVQLAENQGSDTIELLKILGKGRARKGMFEGDLEEGELEIGQVSAMISNILPATQILEDIWADFSKALKKPI